VRRPFFSAAPPERLPERNGHAQFFVLQAGNDGGNVRLARGLDSIDPEAGRQQMQEVVLKGTIQANGDGKGLREWM
jgi:hypothetical protein